MLVELNDTAPVVAKCCVSLHNRLHDPACRKRLGAIIILGVGLIWLGFGVWLVHARAGYQTKQHVAIDLLDTFEATGKAVLVLKADGEVALSSDAANHLLKQHAVGKNIRDICPEIAAPFNAALAAASKNADGQGIAQSIASFRREPDRMLQITVAVSHVVDKPVAIVTILPLDKVDARFVDIKPTPAVVD